MSVSMLPQLSAGPQHLRQLKGVLLEVDRVAQVLWRVHRQLHPSATHWHHLSPVEQQEIHKVAIRAVRMLEPEVIAVVESFCGVERVARMFRILEGRPITGGGDQ